MRKIFLLAVLVLIIGGAVWLAVRASRSSAASSEGAPAIAASDAVEAQVRKLAGKSAHDCGRVAAGGSVQQASECAMQANSDGKPFFVLYDLPAEAGMTVALARSGDGKMYTVQYVGAGWQKDELKGEAQLSDDGRILTEPCPAEGALRVASSGRVTCYPPQAFGGASPHGGGNPHGGMGMGQGAAPHGGITTKPGVPNPHGGEKPEAVKPKRTTGT